MKMTISSSGTMQTFRLRHLLLAASLSMVCLDCKAQALQQIEVKGKDSSWKLVGTVDPLTGFQIGAKGTVNFGGLFHKDDPNAGVTGSAFGKWAKEIVSGGVEALIDYLESANVSDDSAGGGDSTGSTVAGSGDVTTASIPSVMHWNWVDYINENGGTVNYDEGAFFVLITTTSQPPSQDNMTSQVAEPALFYWYKKVFDQGGNIAYNQKVWIWIKVHDGGHDPYSTSSFGDNSGSYTIWIDPDQSINDVQFKASVEPPSFKDTQSAQKLKAAAAKSMIGKKYHVAMVLRRKAPSHHPE